MKSIQPQDVLAKLQKKEPIVLLDVREPSEVSQGKVPGSINIPLGLLSFRTHELSKETSYVVLCHAGGRSAMATQFLTQEGFDVTNMEGGMLAWPGEVE